MKNALYLILFSFIAIIFVACSEDKDLPDPPIGPSITKSVGPEGGEIEFNDIYVNIPSGAFTESRSIEVFELREESDVFENVTTKNYRIDGLPAVIHEDIYVELRSFNSSETEQLVLEYEIYKKGLSQAGLGHRFLSTDNDDGILQTLIPAFDALSNFTDDSEVQTRSGETHWFNIFAVSLISSVESKNNNFLIRIPTAYVNEAEYLGDYLEDAYDKFKDMGFDYSKREKWPVEIIVKKLKNKDRFGAFAGSVYGISDANIEFNVTKLDDKEQLKVTAGHEFFHLVQDWYDPRSTWQKSKSESALLGWLTGEGGAAHLWLDEAMSVWSEKFFTIQSRFAPLVFVENFSYFLGGGYQAYGKSNLKQSYGYSLAPLIEFLHFHYGGDATLVHIYEKIEDKEEGMQIIDDLFITSLSANWPRIIEDVLEFEIYPAQEGTSFDFGALLPALAQSTLPAQQAVASKVFDFSIPGLSAKTVYIKNNNFTGFDPNAVLSIEVLNNADVVLQVYRTNNEDGISEKIAEGTDKITISDFTDYIQSGNKIGAVVINKGTSIPFSDEGMNVNFKVSIEQPIEFIAVETNLNLNGVFEIEERDPIWDVDTVYTRDRRGLGTLPFGFTSNLEYVTTIAGNTYTTNASGDSDDLDVYDGLEYLIVSSFDDASDPTKLSSLEFSGTWYEADTFGGFGKVTTTNVAFKIKDLPYLEFNPLTNSYVFRGDLSRQQIEIAEYTVETVKYVDGQVDPSFYKKEVLKSYQDGNASANYHKE